MAIDRREPATAMDKAWFKMSGKASPSPRRNKKNAGNFCKAPSILCRGWRDGQQWRRWTDRRSWRKRKQSRRDPAATWWGLAVPVPVPAPVCACKGDERGGGKGKGKASRGRGSIILLRRRVGADGEDDGGARNPNKSGSTGRALVSDRSSAHGRTHPPRRGHGHGHGRPASVLAAACMATISCMHASHAVQVQGPPFLKGSFRCPLPPPPSLRASPPPHHPFSLPENRSRSYKERHEYYHHYTKIVQYPVSDVWCVRTCMHAKAYMYVYLVVHTCGPTCKSLCARVYVRATEARADEDQWCPLPASRGEFGAAGEGGGGWTTVRRARSPASCAGVVPSLCAVDRGLVGSGRVRGASDLGWTCCGRMVSCDPPQTSAGGVGTYVQYVRAPGPLLHRGVDGSGSRKI